MSTAGRDRETRAGLRSWFGNLRKVPRKVWLRLAALGAIVATGVILVLFTPLRSYLDEASLIELLDGLRSYPYTPLLLILSFALSAPFGIPSSPILIAGGVVFGPVLGSVYNGIGLVSGAMTAYWVARALGREFVVQVAGPRLRRAEMALQRQGFWPLVQIRFLPVPLSVVSYAAALAGVSSSRFFAASAIGLLPATLVHTYFGPALLLRPSLWVFVGYPLSMVALNVIFGWPIVRERLRRRRRYRELIEERRERLSAREVLGDQS